MYLRYQLSNLENDSIRFRVMFTTEGVGGSLLL